VSGSEFGSVADRTTLTGVSCKVDTLTAEATGAPFAATAVTVIVTVAGAESTLVSFAT
jgi:hypothetical protein